MTTHRLICLYDEAALRADPTLRERLCDWMRSLGLKPEELAEGAAVLKSPEGQYELHVSKVLRQADGSIWVDRVQLRVVTQPVIVPLGATFQAKWPEPKPVRVPPDHAPSPGPALRWCRAPPCPTTTAPED